MIITFNINTIDVNSSNPERITKVPTSFLKRAFLFSGDVNLFRRAKKIEMTELCKAKCALCLE
jgi:hypothetical protein